MFEVSISLTAPSEPDAPTGDRRIETIVAIERQIARLQAEQAEQVAALCTEREGVAGYGWSGGQRSIAAEVGLARGVSTPAAEHQVAVAQALITDFPLLLDLLHRGELSWVAAAAVCRECWVVDTQVRREVDRRLAAEVERGAAAWFPVGQSGAEEDLPPLDDAPGDVASSALPAPGLLVESVRGEARLVVLPEVRPQPATAARLARAARRLVMELDAEAAARRAARARAERGVRVCEMPDGDAELVARLGAEHAADCWHALDHHARALHAAGDPRSVSQLMADTLVERVTGVAAGVGHPAPRPPHAQVHVLVPVSTLTGADERPGEVRGLGPVPAGVAREIAAAPTSRLRRVLVDDGGRVLSMDRTTRSSVVGRRETWLFRPADWSIHDVRTDQRFFAGDLRTFIGLRDGWCRMPTCESAVTNADHIRPHASDGPTSAANGQGLSVRCHHLRDLPGWQVSGHADRVVWTTPTGHRYESRPPPVCAPAVCAPPACAPPAEPP